MGRKVTVYDKYANGVSKEHDHDQWRIVGICWPAVWQEVKDWLCIALVFGLFTLWGFSRV